MAMLDRTAVQFMNKFMSDLFIILCSRIVVDMLFVAITGTVLVFVSSH